MVAAMNNGDILLLENLRFHAEEEADDPDFAAQLAAITDVYVNDAFGTAHRAHASTAGLPALVEEKGAGLLMEREFRFLGLAVERPERPLVAILGGSKISGKIDVIEALPDGLDTLVGERGYRLSGGEKQRLSIARMLLKDPAVVVLDEATSQVDTDSEQRINDAMRSVRQGRTTLVVAHRLGTVLECDRIVVLEEGRIVGDGTHEQLAADCPPYRRLFDLDTKLRHG